LSRDDLDRLGVLSRYRPMRVKFGETEVTLAMRGGSVRQGMSSRGEIQLVLEPSALPADPVDYLARLEARSGREGGSKQFVGHASRVGVRPDGRIEVEAHGAQVLTETSPGQFVHLDMQSADVIYAIARSAGLGDDELFIPALGDLAHETFEIIAPVQGVTVTVPRPLAGVTLLPRDDVLRRLVEMGFDELDAVADASAFALGLRTARLAYEAEQAGLRQIDLALDWLAARLRHAVATFPDGELQTFDRGERRAVPRRGDLVVIRGLLTGRRWLRSALPEIMRTTVPLADNDPLLDRLPGDLRPSERLALAACHRAVAETDALERVQAIWEAVEFIVAGVQVPRRWSHGDLRAIHDALPEDLPQALLTRAREAIAALNQVPLMARLRHLIEQEGLPCSDAEMDLLASLRRVRNDAGHGRETRAPSQDELDHATAVICRLAVVRFSESIGPTRMPASASA
jgi:hypothetical protein